MITQRRAAWLSTFLLVLPLLGCLESDWFKPKPPPEDQPAVADESKPILEGTIGARAVLSGAEPLTLRGFGVVIGLGENGSADCPTTIREYLIDYFQSEFASEGETGQRIKFSPDKLIDSLDTAVVSVMAQIPAGAPKGARVDLQVQAIGNSTRSIEGGMLLPCELKIFDANASGTGLIAGRPLARARGPVFTNPFVSRGADSEAPTRAPRRGFVLGGGLTLEPRTVQLVLSEPSYSTARLFERRVNERFVGRPAAAIARSASYVELFTPAAFVDDADRFLSIVTHLYPENSPEYVDRRLRDVREQVNTESSDCEHAAWIWEGIGAAALPEVRTLYAAERDDVRFYAARVGARLKDAGAQSVLTDLALAGGEFALLAVRELAICELPRSAARLAPLLDSDNQELRIAAYEALREEENPSVRTRKFRVPSDLSQTNFQLDIVASRGRPMVYVTRVREPRIAVFGAPLPVRRPLFYSHPEELVMLSAAKASDPITLFTRTRSRKLLSEKLTARADVVDLIARMAEVPLADESGQVAGLGLTHAVIVQALHSLCADGTIPARLVLEQASTVDLLGPVRPRERREADDADADVPPPDESDAPPEIEPAAPGERPEGDGQ